MKKAPEILDAGIGLLCASQKTSDAERPARLVLQELFNRSCPAQREDLACHLDLVPTVLSWTGLAAPAALPGVDLLAADLATDRGPVHLSYDGNFLPGYHKRAVVASRYKLVRHMDGEEEFFDLEADPLEMVNLIGQAHLKSEADGLRAEGRNWSAQYGDPFDWG